ncbi:MAG TPA: methyltransferase, partial [Ohtaekwangia sp.]|uniref:methyltransferase n=1 Tax=Ohtaekwangia sp. TaxID=2066019 RepID=UPI002F92FC8C
LFCFGTWLQPTSFIPMLLAILIATTITISLAVSCYIYDYSGLYTLHWLDSVSIAQHIHIVNIHAGFDETSNLLQHRYPTATLRIFDFYDPTKHTEVSIKRARKLYPCDSSTEHITTRAVPLQANSTDVIFTIFATHEIRNRDERITFLAQLQNSLQHEGKCIVVEHLRDVPNFLIYTIGVFHFFSKREWLANFSAAGFITEQEIKITPFISAFVLQKDHGYTS